VGYAPVAPKKIATSRPLQPFVPGQPLRQAIAPAAFAHPKANREVRLEGAVVGYAFTRAKRRTIGFVVGPDGLVVRAPRWTPLHEVDAALQEKGAWILRKLNETRARHVRREEARIDWRDGTQLPVLGKTIAVQLDPAHSFASKGAELSFDGTEDALAILKVALPKAAEPQQIRDAVQALLMSQAKDNFHQRLDHFAPLVGVQWRKLR
jgi:predicted metal-dependent hydrolase